MKITSITLIFLILSFAAISHTIYRLKNDRVGIRSAIVWLLLWSSIGFFGLFPNLLDPLMQLAMMKNRMFFIMVVAIVIVYTVIFNLSSQMDKVQRTSARLIQEVSLLRHQLEKLDNAKD
jgi:hypothetical protein